MLKTRVIQMDRMVDFTIGRPLQIDRTGLVDRRNKWSRTTKIVEKKMSSRQWSFFLPTSQPISLKIECPWLGGNIQPYYQ